MRVAEARITIVLLTAITVVVGATYWLAARNEAHTPLTIARGAGVVGGAAACVALGIAALHQEVRRHRRRALELARQWILAPGGGSNPLAKDKELTPFLTPLRQRVDELTAKADTLQVQKKNLEIQLRLADAQRRQSQIMLQGISDAVLITDGFDELLLANPAAASIFGFDLAAATKKPISVLLADKPGSGDGASRLAADISDMRQNHARTNRRTAEYQLEYDGKLRTFSVTLTCVIDNTDQFAGVVAMLHDRTREDEISKMKTDFVSHVSHELRTPLSSIKAYAELLVDGEATDDKTRSEFYHIIQAEADRLSRLIDNILNISRIESGMTRVHKKPVALNGLLKQVLEVAMPSARDKQITMVDQVSPVFFSVDADRDMIYQAALNLVSNAIKYTPTGGTVRVTLAADDVTNELTVLVTDTGVGIPPDAMKHLFEKFFRVEQNKNMAKGSGLGLNLTRQIIEAIHKGRMIVQSEVGKGSTFGFALPIAA
ncbi:MAG TPA: ATP-binding protein [Phycisphaerae bacterium]|nr:ATP-binding protein [Phycisphaerae bacterium]